MRLLPWKYQPASPLRASLRSVCWMILWISTKSPFKNKKYIFQARFQQKTGQLIVVYDLHLSVTTIPLLLDCSFFRYAKLAFTHISAVPLKCWWMPLLKCRWNHSGVPEEAAANYWGGWWSYWDADRKSVLVEQCSVQNVLEIKRFILFEWCFWLKLTGVQKTDRKRVLRGLKGWYFQGNNLAY